MSEDQEDRSLAGLYQRHRNELMARYQISQNLSATVNLDNVFDRKYFSVASSYGTYGAPRNLMAGFRYDF